MIRTKGEAGTGNVVEAVRHIGAVTEGIRRLQTLGHEQLMAPARDLGAPFDLVEEVASTGKLPVVNFAAGGLATPAGAALMILLGCDGVFVGSGIFKSADPGPGAKGRSSRRPRICLIRRSWQRCRAVSASRWSASRWTPSLTRTGWPDGPVEPCDSGCWRYGVTFVSMRPKSPLRV